MAKKYIDAEKIAKAIEDKGLDCSFALKMERLDTLALIDELQQEMSTWIKFLPSNKLPRERVTIAYDTHDERKVRYAYGYFQFNPSKNWEFCGFQKDGNEQPKRIKTEDILYWKPLEALPEFSTHQQEQPEKTCLSCGFHENNCPFIRGKLIPYPNKVCKDYTYSAIKEQEHPTGNLEHWLEFFGMPKENIENCITQIAQGYGACRYLEGVQHGAEAVNELAEQEQPEVDLENYISNKLRDLGADLINHKPYSFNRGLNVGKTNAYNDILDRLNARKEELVCKR